MMETQAPKQQVETDAELKEEAMETVVGGAGATAGLYGFNPQPEPPGFGLTQEIEEREQSTTIVR